MQDIIDTYINNYDEIPNGKNSYECEVGNLTFIKDSTDRIILFEIYINAENRRQGICKNLIITCIIRSIQVKRKFMIVSVISKILYNFLLNFRCNYGNFILTDEGFLFKTKNHL